MTVTLNDNITIDVTIPAHIVRKWHGTDFTFIPERMDATTRAAIFSYGLRVYNDKYAKLGETTSGKAACLRLAIDASNAGEAWEGRAASVQRTPLETMELTVARDELKRRFKGATGFAYAKHWIAASETIAAYFKGTTFIDEKVREWINSPLGIEFDVSGRAQSKIDEMADLKAKAKVDVSTLF